MSINLYVHFVHPVLACLDFLANISGFSRTKRSCYPYPKVTLSAERLIFFIKSVHRSRKNEAAYRDGYAIRLFILAFSLTLLSTQPFSLVALRGLPTVDYSDWFSRLCAKKNGRVWFECSSIRWIHMLRGGETRCSAVRSTHLFWVCRPLKVLGKGVQIFYIGHLWSQSF